MRFETIRWSIALAAVALLTCGAAGALKTWTGGGGTTSWHDANNWSPPGVPGPGDQVEIDVAGSETIMFTNGTTAIESLQCAETLSFTGGVLRVETNATVGAIHMAAGQIEGGTWQVTQQLTSVAHGPGLLKDLTFVGSIALNVTSAQVRFQNVDLDGTATLSGPYSRIAFEGTQTLPRGTIVFGAARGVEGYPRLQMGAAGTLTLGPDVVIRGGGGSIGYPGTPAMAVVSEGTNIAETPETTLWIQSASMTNRGMFRSTAGRITVTTLWINGGGSTDVSGGMIELLGTLENTDAVFTLDEASGPLMVGANGTIRGGTLHVAAPEHLQFWGGNIRFENLDIQGNMEVSDGHSVIVKNIDLQGVITLRDAQSSLRFDGSQAFPRGTVVFDFSTASEWRPAMQMHTAGTVTLGPEVVVRGGNGRIGSTVSPSVVPMTLINQGRIEADIAGRTIQVSPAVLTNTGSLLATAGTLRTMPTSWGDATGTLRASNGGTFILGGFIDNDGSTIALECNGGTLTYDDGELVGGELIITGSPLGMSEEVENRMEGVTIHGDLVFPINQAVLRVREITLDGTIAFSGSSSSLIFEGSQTFPTGTLHFPATSPSQPSGGMKADPTTSVVTFGPDVVVSGGHGGISSSMGLINQGLIISESSTHPSQALTINATPFTNQGTLKATAGTLKVGSSSWTNDGGTLIADGGALWIGGVLDNSDSVLAVDARTGPIMLNGSIIGGTVNVTAPGTLTCVESVNSRLKDLTFNGDLTLNGSSTARFSNVDLHGTATLLAGSRIAFEGQQTQQRGTFVFAPVGTSSAPRLEFWDQSGSVTFGPEVVIRGRAGYLGHNSTASSESYHMVNHGTILLDEPGHTRFITVGTFVNHGTITVDAGTLRVDHQCHWTNHGAVHMAPATTLDFQYVGPWSSDGPVTCHGVELAHLRWTGV